MKRQRSLSSANSMVLFSVLPDLAKQFYAAWSTGDVSNHVAGALRNSDDPQARLLRELMNKDAEVAIEDLHVSTPAPCPSALATARGGLALLPPVPPLAGTAYRFAHLLPFRSPASTGVHQDLQDRGRALVGRRRLFGRRGNDQGDALAHIHGRRPRLLLHPVRPRAGHLRVLKHGRGALSEEKGGARSAGAPAGVGDAHTV